MSFIYRDFLTPSRFAWNRASSVYHRFDRVWGKENDSGVIVYSPRLVYWSGSVRSDKPFKMFVNILGIEYKSLTNAKYEGVTQVYLKLEPQKYSYVAPEKDDIVNDLNSVFSIGDEFELYVHYSGESKRVVDTHYLLRDGRPSNSTDIKDYTIDKNAIRATLESDPFKYFANASLTSSGKINTAKINSIKGFPVMRVSATRRTARPAPLTVVEYDSDSTHLYSTLALLDNGSMFQKLGVYGEMVTIKNSSDSLVYYDYSYKVKYKVVSLATNTKYIVNQIDLLTNAISSSLAYSGGKVYEATNHFADTKLKEAVIAMNNASALPITHNGKLRVDAVALMKRKDFVDMLGKILGSGYEKEKVKWYEKALAVIVVVIAIVAMYFSFGSSYAVSGSMVAAAAESLAVGAVVLSVGMVMYSSAFPSATDQTKMIGRVAQIVGLAAMITGIWAAIQNSFATMAQKAGTQASQEAAQEGASEAAQKAIMENVTREYSVGQYVKDILFNTVSDMTSQVQNMFSFENISSKFSTKGLSSLTMKDVSGWLDNLNSAMKMYMKFFGDKIDSLKSEDEQAVKEDGVEAYYGAVAMIDEVDALVKMDYMIKGNNGGEITNRLMTRL